MLVILSISLQAASQLKVPGLPEGTLYFPIISEGDWVKQLIALGSLCPRPLGQPSSLSRFIASKHRTEESLLAAVRHNYSVDWSTTLALWYLWIVWTCSAPVSGCVILQKYKGALSVGISCSTTQRNMGTHSVVWQFMEDATARVSLCAHHCPNPAWVAFQWASALKVTVGHETAVPGLALWKDLNQLK